MFDRGPTKEAIAAMAAVAGNIGGDGGGYLRAREQPADLRSISEPM